MWMLYVCKLCVGVSCVEEGRREEEKADGSAQPKTITPHNDVGNKKESAISNSPYSSCWALSFYFYDSLRGLLLGCASQLAGR